MSLTCYGCNKTEPIDEFRFKCMCTEKRGVCKKCVGDCIKVTIPPSHHLTRLHDLTPEFIQWHNMVNQECPGWSTMLDDVDGVKVFSYYESPDGKTGNEFWHWVCDNMMFGQTAQFIKYKRFPVPKTCFCCK